MDKEKLSQKGVRLEYLTICWIVINAFTALASGVVSGSIALIGYGLNSGIEVVEAALFLRRFHPALRGPVPDEKQSRGEGKTRFVAGVALFLVALYILNESGSRLYFQEKAEPSSVGLVLAALSIIIMAVLAIMKLRTAAARESGAFRARAGSAAIFSVLAMVLFLGLGLHERFGWWWADAVAALLMIPLIVLQGWEAIEASKETGRRGIIGTRTRT